MMMTGFRFATAINCIDGRTQQAVIDYMKQTFGVDGVDLVTFPGTDGIFSNGEDSVETTLAKRAVAISIQRHGSKVIAVIGHHDCAGNPVNKEHHYEDIRKAIRKVHSWNFPAQIVGLYVNDKWTIEEIQQ